MVCRQYFGLIATSAILWLSPIISAQAEELSLENITTVFQEEDWVKAPTSPLDEADISNAHINLETLSKEGDVVTFDVESFAPNYVRLQTECGTDKIKMLHQGYFPKGDRSVAVYAVFFPDSWSKANLLQQYLSQFACDQFEPIPPPDAEEGFQCIALNETESAAPTVVEYTTLSEGTKNAYTLRNKTVYEEGYTEFYLDENLYLVAARSFYPNGESYPWKLLSPAWLKLDTDGTLFLNFQGSSDTWCTLSTKTTFGEDVREQIFPDAPPLDPISDVSEVLEQVGTDTTLGQVSTWGEWFESPQAFNFALIAGSVLVGGAALAFGGPAVLAATAAAGRFLLGSFARNAVPTSTVSAINKAVSRSHSVAQKARNTAIGYKPRPFKTQKQAEHVKGTPQYKNRVKQEEPISTFNNAKEGEKLTQEAWARGRLLIDRGNTLRREFDFNRPVGTGPKGGTQSKVRVHMNKKGQIHGHPSGPETPLVK